MKKLIKTQDILLLSLSATLDFFEELKDPLQLVSKSYENMYGWVPKKYTRHHFRHLVWRSLKTGYIEKVKKNGELYIRLTSRGTAKITRDFPLLLMQKRVWDKKWRIVIFDIEENDRKRRDILRDKLKELGFGMLQKSVFISPHDIATDFAEFIEDVGLGEFVYIFETSSPMMQDPKKLANKVWYLGDLNNKYREIIERLKGLQNKYLIKLHDRTNFLNSKRRFFEKVKEIKEEYLAISSQDPFLPKELLPQTWERDEAQKLLMSLTKLYG